MKRYLFLLFLLCLSVSGVSAQDYELDTVEKAMQQPRALRILLTAMGMSEEWVSFIQQRYPQKDSTSCYVFFYYLRGQFVPVDIEESVAFYTTAHFLLLDFFEKYPQEREKLDQRWPVVVYTYQKVLSFAEKYKDACVYDHDGNCLKEKSSLVLRTVNDIIITITNPFFYKVFRLLFEMKLDRFFSMLDCAISSPDCLVSTKRYFQQEGSRAALRDMRQVQDKSEAVAQLEQVGGLWLLHYLVLVGDCYAYNRHKLGEAHYIFLQQLLTMVGVYFLHFFPCNRFHSQGYTSTYEGSNLTHIKSFNEVSYV